MRVCVKDRANECLLLAEILVLPELDGLGQANSHGRHNDSFLNLLPCAHFKSMDLIQLSSTHPVATAAAALVMAGASTMFYYFVIEPATSPLNALPGPP
ncbi:hypothetical protein Ae201684_018197 [Aphanomyces euteiches]|uniref:Uncharacterized protein n=1 Tax=Aphanomyces euteiches TaxID=100861 RepID=A0A6G0W6F5_9STRA|nr:hypothetical protein Ae201684_018197 [Aphanomyces euteiches]